MYNANDASLSPQQHLLITLNVVPDNDIVTQFNGSVYAINADKSNQSLTELANQAANKHVYICGDISVASRLSLSNAKTVNIISALSYDYQGNTPDSWSVIDLGRVPISVHGLGVYYRRFFAADGNYFQRISAEHTFQSLTESTKPGVARRTGLYLTPVQENQEGRHFRLLRCSTNLACPTENFQATDNRIVNELNQVAADIFTNAAPLNHVLAQTYRNQSETQPNKQAKARISSHADKTKDMPTNGIMAFCTFYDQLERLSPLAEHSFDYGYKRHSGLTQLRFRKKTPTKNGADQSSNEKLINNTSIDALPNDFTITLYPDSVFYMPLSTNRLYTHEIRPSMLDASMLPTRLGYVVRCSNTEALHSNGQTYLKPLATTDLNTKTNVPLTQVMLEPATSEGISELRKLYAEENRTANIIDYGRRFAFSMNEGDYLAPTYQARDEFQCYSLPSHWLSSTHKDHQPFQALHTTTQWQTQGKGRHGQVLVRPVPRHGIPLVRTTTQYTQPAQCFHELHERLAQVIQQQAALPTTFNHALIEHYTLPYRRMGFHSDQAQDLQAHSYIALYSCYQYPGQPSSRKLIIEAKTDHTSNQQAERFEITLNHNSVIIFSTDTNQRFRHKIVYDHHLNNDDNPWIGVTLRTAKTFVQQHNQDMQLANGATLALANETQRRELLAMRKQENQQTGYTYPELNYTLSNSDLKLPTS